MPGRVVGTITAGVRLVDLEAEAKAVRELAAKVTKAAEDAGGEEQVRAAGKGAAATFSKAVNDWATRQASEVVAGKAPLARWRDYKGNLEAQARSFLRDFEERGTWLYKLTSWVGSKVEAAADDVARRVRSVRAEYEKIGKVRARVEAMKRKLRGSKLSTVGTADLFGAPAQRAEETWQQLTRVLEGLERAAGLVTGGKATLTATKGDVKLSGLGGLPVLAAGTVVATVAIAGSLAASLWSYYNHADEVARSEVARIELELVKAGRGAEVAQLRKLRTESDKARAEGLDASPFGALATVGRWVGGGLVVASIAGAVAAFGKRGRP
jgi:hypothetical protein